MPYLSVNVDMEDFDSDDMIEELERRGYVVIENAAANEKTIDNIQDEIYNLYQAFAYDSQENMYKVLKQFLEKHTGKLIV